MSPARFLAFFPEFSQSDQSVVAAKLTQASARMGGPDVRIWGCFALDSATPTMADVAQSNLAAFYLVTSPFGTETRGVPDGKEITSPYWKVWEECMLAVSGGVTVGGGSRGLPCGPWWP